MAGEQDLRGLLGDADGHVTTSTPAWTASIAAGVQAVPVSGSVSKRSSYCSQLVERERVAPFTVVAPDPS